jgi:hypothetical protein
MATPATALSPRSPESTGGEPRIIALLRELREDVQNLLESIDRIQAVSQLTQPEAREAIPGIGAGIKPVFDRTQERVAKRLEGIRSVFAAHEGLHARYGDAVADISNHWDHVVEQWPTGTEAPALLAQQIKDVDACIGSIVYRCALLTIPERVNENLAEMRVGQTLDFRMQFHEELPDEQQQTRILEYLARHPKLVSGFVDAPAGLIYRASARTRRRYASLGMFAIVLLIPLVILIPGLWKLLEVDLLPGTLALSYAVIAAGSAAHLVVLLLKQQRSANAGTGFLISDWLLIAHVRETPIVFSILSLWIGLAGLAWMGEAGNLATAFFVGYSLDSFVDLFLARFETGANAAVEAARAKLTK